MPTQGSEESERLGHAIHPRGFFMNRGLDGSLKP